MMPLGHQQSQCVALRLQGKTNTEIADELQMDASQVAAVLHVAKRKGYVLPKPKNHPRRNAPTIAKLLHARDLVRNAGYGRGEIYPAIAVRVGLTPNNVKVRLWRHDKQQQRGQT